MTSSFSDEQWRIIHYLNFKMECLAKQEDYGLAIDKDSIQKHIDELQSQKDPIISSLKEAMPKVPQYRKKSKPKVTHKKDGTLSKLGEEWFRLLKSNKLPMNYSGDLEILTGYEDPNPGSTPQVKDWLFSMGWEPTLFKYTRNKETGEEKKVEQVRHFSPSDPKRGELADCVIKLKEKNPAVEYLEKITLINHRISVLEGFLNNVRTDRDYPYVVAGAGGFTNTLRFKHRTPVVNLPKVGKFFGEEIRGSLVAKKGKIFLGSDMVSLESTTRDHYIQPHDPDLVKKSLEKGFDPHLLIAVSAGLITEEDYKFYGDYQDGEGEEEDRFNRIKKVRDQAKTTNYSALYGVGAKKLARELGVSISSAAELLTAFWEVNWAVKKVSSEQYVKTLKDGSAWVKNPVSGFYHNLRYEKDIWSTLNQSTGVYCFDTWNAYCAAAGVEIVMQMHDEILVECDDDEQSIKDTKERMQNAITKTNEKVKLNVQLSIDVQTGYNYSQVH